MPHHYRILIILLDAVVRKGYDRGRKQMNTQRSTSNAQLSRVGVSEGNLPAGDRDRISLLWGVGGSKKPVFAKRTPQLTAHFANAWADGSRKVARFVWHGFRAPVYDPPHLNPLLQTPVRRFRASCRLGSPQGERGRNTCVSAKRTGFKTPEFSVEVVSWLDSSLCSE